MMQLPTTLQIYDGITTFCKRVADEYAELTNFPYARLLRLNRPESLTLLVWPLLWGFLSAPNISWNHLLIAIPMVIVLRAAAGVYEGMTLPPPTTSDDVPDHPTEPPSPLLLVVLSGLGMWLSLSLGPATLLAVVVWAGFVIAYPFVQRVTWWPELYAAFTHGALVVLIGQTAAGGLSLAVLMVLPAAFFWLAALETLRADVRRLQDLEKGLRSLVLMLGRSSLPFIAVSLIATQVALILAGMGLDANGLYYGALMLAQILFTQACREIKLDETTSPKTTFRKIVLAGGVISLGFLVGT
jgi:4-hydroxybenzoate polyprenyltransferase